LNRDIYSLSHCKFRERLLYRAKVTPGTTVILCKESFTTKTCGKCGKLTDVGINKVYSCMHCEYKADRDVHGARNIFIRSLTKFFEGLLLPV
jgi:putative transposase